MNFSVVEYISMFLLQICPRLLQLLVLSITLMLLSMTDQLSLYVMLTVIQHQPIDGWTSVQEMLQMGLSIQYQRRQNTVYNVQQATTSHLLTAESYHTVCLHGSTSTVCPLAWPLHIYNIRKPILHERTLHFKVVRYYCCFISFLMQNSQRLENCNSKRGAII